MGYRPPVFDSRGDTRGLRLENAKAWCDECGDDVPVIRAAYLYGRRLRQFPDGLGLCDGCEIKSFGVIGVIDHIIRNPMALEELNEI